MWEVSAATPLSEGREVVIGMYQDDVLCLCDCWFVCVFVWVASADHTLSEGREVGIGRYQDDVIVYALLLLCFSGCGGWGQRDTFARARVRPNEDSVGKAKRARQKILKLQKEV